MKNEPEWTPPHSHDPNPLPPSADPTLSLHLGDVVIDLALEELSRFIQQEVADLSIVSTGHGRSGPFTFGGVSLNGLIECYSTGSWSAVDVISADGFRTRLSAEELKGTPARPVLLAIAIDGRKLTRQEGLVRLIVPQETDGALRQVKWVREIRIID